MANTATSCSDVSGACALARSIRAYDRPPTTGCVLDDVQAKLPKRQAAQGPATAAAKRAGTGAAALERGAGVLLHLTSLPNAYGIGDLGPSAYGFLEAMARARQSWWQILPLGPPGAGNCPYNCYSAMAGNTNLISPDLLYRDGLLSRADLRHDKFPADHVDFAPVTRFKNMLLSRAWNRFKSQSRGSLATEFDHFRDAEAWWLDDFSLFVALRHRQEKTWTQWDRALVLRKPAALQAVARELEDDISCQRFAQFVFYRQLAALRDHAAQCGIKLIGDMPFFVAADSSDVWANPHLFRLARNRQPSHVSGVPPDYFSAQGQRWGNPLYNWAAMRREGFRWWIERARMALRQTDLVRLDHFRGFGACWTIDADQPTAEHGRWTQSPGEALFNALRNALHALPFIAEDLGDITPDVLALRDRFGLPGMRVLQFGFSGDWANPFLPHNYIRNAVAYTATHDNDTARGWYESLSAEERKHLLRYAPEAKSDPAHALLRLAWSSVAAIAIAPLQDVLGLGSEARMNLPGSPFGHWGWRFRERMLHRDHLDELAELTTIYGRARRQ